MSGVLAIPSCNSASLEFTLTAGTSGSAVGYSSGVIGSINPSTVIWRGHSMKLLYTALGNTTLEFFTGSASGGTGMLMLMVLYIV